MTPLGRAWSHGGSTELASPSWMLPQARLVLALLLSRLVAEASISAHMDPGHRKGTE